MSFFPPDIMLLERQTNITWSQIYSKSETDILRFSNNLFLNAILMLIFFFSLMQNTLHSQGWTFI